MGWLFYARILQIFVFTLAVLSQNPGLEKLSQIFIVLCFYCVPEGHEEHDVSGFTRSQTPQLAYWDCLVHDGLQVRKSCITWVTSHGWHQMTQFWITNEFCNDLTHTYAYNSLIFHCAATMGWELGFLTKSSTFSLRNMSLTSRSSIEREWSDFISTSHWRIRFTKRANIFMTGTRSDYQLIFKCIYEWMTNGEMLITCRFVNIEIKNVKFEDSLFENCYFEDIKSTETFFENCTLKNTVFYNTGAQFMQFQQF